MLTENSILHVEQDVGKAYALDRIRGYYNDLTGKVIKDKDIIEIKIPLFQTPHNDRVEFPITIFQYGLGAYDLYILEKKDIYLEKFKVCVKWALENQKEDGSWNAFYFIYPDAPYSCMAQGEGASLLIRAYVAFGDDVYLKAAEKAINFMITPIEQGGTARYTANEITFLECTDKPEVLNGWIFSLFGLFDYFIISQNNEIKDIFDRSVSTLINHLNEFDTGYWSKYDNGKMIASPFYHKLHISLLKVIYKMTGEKVFMEFSEKWTNYSNRLINRTRAFITKAFQKVLEK